MLFRERFELTDTGFVSPGTAVNTLNTFSEAELQYYISQLDHGNPPGHGRPPMKTIIAVRKSSRMAQERVTKTDKGALTMMDCAHQSLFRLFDVR